MAQSPRDHRTVPPSVLRFRVYGLGFCYLVPSFRASSGLSMEPSSPSHAAEGAARFLPFKKDRGKFECQLLGPPSLSSWHLLTSCFDNRYDSIGFSEPAQQTLIACMCHWPFVQMFSVFPQLRCLSTPLAAQLERQPCRSF